VEYDTAIIGGGNYPLPSGKVLVLLLQAESGEVWTTIRRWTPDKEQYYRGLRGMRLAVVVACEVAADTKKQVQNAELS
jgi:hypothetical protein